MTATAPTPVLDPRALKARFPILARTVHGRPLVYLDNAATTQKPDSVLGRVDALLRALQRQRPPRRAHPRRGGHRGLRGVPDAGRGVRQCPRPARRRHPAQRHRGDQPGRTLVGREARRRRRGAPHRDGAPLQPCAVDHARARARRRAQAHPDHRRRRARPRQAPRAAHQPHEDRRLHGDVERARDDQPGGRDRGRGAPRRRTRPRRRGAVRASLAGRLPGARHRLPRLLRAQGVRPDRGRLPRRHPPLSTAWSRSSAAAR